ncbi:hypothetical protein KEM56_000203 [Ascosphaera pollenicola]|nr:hypothetical protein KEM56_000203 [Ascosphaera pollenicola]
MSFTLIPRTRVVFRCATLGAQASRNAFGGLISTSSSASPVRAIAALQRCGYATATATKSAAAKPKADPAAKKPTAKKTVAKKTPAKKTVRKTAAKKPAKKPVKKAKKKAVKKVVKPKKKVLSERQKTLLAKKQARELVAELKEKALKPPAKLPDQVMTLFMKEKATGSGNIQEIARSYKLLPEEEVQRLTKAAASNRETNNQAYKNWLESLTPLQIREANIARKRLNTILKKTAYRQINDDRTVTRPRTPYILFFKDHYAAQVQPDEKITQTMTRIASMWKNLSVAEKQKYLALAQQDRNRYINEFKHAYGQEPVLAKAAATA